MSYVAMFLNLFYALLPLSVMLDAGGRAWRDRSPRPLRPLTATFLSAAVIGFGLNLAYAHAAAARWLWSEVLARRGCSRRCCSC
jgi:hypothetical protein